MVGSSGMARAVDIAPGRRAVNRRLPLRAREGESITWTGATKDRQNGDSVSRTSRAYASARDAQSDSGRRSGSQIDRPLAYHTRLRDGGDEELAFRRERSDEDQNIISVLLRDSRRYGDIRRRRGITFDSSRVRGLQRRRCEADGCGRCSVARERRGHHDATHAERSVGNRGGGLWRHCG